MSPAITRPILLEPSLVAPDTYSLPGYLPIPGLGLLPVNAFLILGAEPVLIDTGLAAVKADFLQALSRLMDPQDLRWIWLTHTDQDHLGNLLDVLAIAPQARLITNFLGMGKLGLQQLPVDRCYLLNPGQRLELRDRTLVALQPPSYDAPETMGLFDGSSRSLFSSDCFGAPLPTPVANARQLPAPDLQAGIVQWAMVDTPWLTMVSPQAFEQALNPLRQLQPDLVLSSHLPPAPGMIHPLLFYLQSARLATPAPLPDRVALEQMMAALMAA